MIIMNRTSARALCVALIGSLAGCAIQAPSLDVRPPDHAEGRFTASSDTSIEPVPSHWWRLYRDDTLNRLVKESLLRNADLRVAYARLDKARAVLSSSQRARLPTTAIESSLGVDFPSSQPSAASLTSSDYDIAATASWDLDLFGRLRSAARAAKADSEAQQAALDGVRVAVAADTTLAYVDYCGANASADVAAAVIDARRKSVALLESQLAVGEISPLEVAQARNLLASARATRPTFEAAAANARYRLAVLQGVAPGQAGSWTWDCRQLPHLAADVAVGDGQTLLLRRPDIREAERRIAAAASRVGVARADLYPKVNLAGAWGLLAGAYVSTTTPLITWNFPNISVTRARIAGSEADTREALALWESTILNALGEVETGIANYQSRMAELAALDDALAQARLYARRARARVRLGDAGSLVEVDAERVRAATALQQAQTRLEVARAQVSLFRALGGGWQNAPKPIVRVTLDG